jgi:drug/metabolite transporter (DMT)-like permease
MVEMVNPMHRIWSCGRWNKLVLEQVMGLILILLTGLLWSGIGVVLGVAVRRRYDVLSFITVAFVMSSICSWVLFLDWRLLLAGAVERPGALVLLLTAAGAAGGMGMFFLQRSMVAGAAAWTVGQSALVIPFLAGSLFLGEPLRISGVLGVAAIVLSMIAFSRGNRQSQSGSDMGTGQKWLRHALAAFLLLGAQQALSSVPSSWPGWTDSAGLRVPITLTAGVLPFLVISVRRGMSLDRAVWGIAAAYAVLVIAGQYLLFCAMDQLSLEGRLSLAFPLALGTSIVIFAMWDLLVWKRCPDRLTTIGICLGLLGVIALAK